MTETSTLVSSIPLEGITIKEAVSCLLVGLPITARNCGANFQPEITPNEVLVAFEKLARAEMEAVVPLRFQAGDMWNQLHLRNYSALKSDFMALLKGKLSTAAYKKQLRRFREYGWVAHKWPEDCRSTKKGWTFYVKNDPGTPGKKRTETEEDYLLGVRWYKEGPDIFVIGEGKNGQKTKTRIPGNLPMEPEAE